MDLAARLGMRRERVIRELIRTNMKEISDLGRLPAIPATSHDGSGAKQVNEYWLNEEQALLLCILSRTPAAKEARADVPSHAAA